MVFYGVPTHSGVVTKIPFSIPNEKFLMKRVMG